MLLRLGQILMSLSYTDTTLIGNLINKLTVGNKKIDANAYQFFKKIMMKFTRTKLFVKSFPTINYQMN